jgi:ribosomal protein S18 acetylase RimI-like enzyme
MLEIVNADWDKQLTHVRGLFREYAATLEFDLSFQDFEKELAALAHEYAPPYGRVLLAVYDREVVGCVALRRIDQPTCEMKRLYVRPAFRGKGVGKALALATIDEARKAEYARMRLDTVPSMTAAIALYKSLGFRDIAPYRHNPIEGARFMELAL